MNTIFPRTRSWRVARNYVLEDGYIKPAPGTKFREYKPFDFYDDDLLTEPRGRPESS
jgi:hypothetical protein